MKTKLFSILFIVPCLLYLFPVYGQDGRLPKFKKQKSYSKSYSVSPNDNISLDNQFGEMKLITWDKKEVKVDVSVTAMADNEDSAQKLLDCISINDDKTSDGVSFKTKFASERTDTNYHKADKQHYTNERMIINYTVYLPSANPVNAKNRFGALIVPDYLGEATLTAQFGSLSTGKIMNAKKITVKFSQLNIGQVNNGKLDIQYSTGNINKLMGEIDAGFQYCTQLKINIDNDIKRLNINTSYSTLYLDLSKNYSADYNISSAYGSFTNQSNFNIKGDNEQGNRYTGMIKKYSGTSGSGANKLIIHCSYGSIIAGHDLKVDTSKKKKTALI